MIRESSITPIWRTSLPVGSSHCSFLGTRALLLCTGEAVALLHVAHVVHASTSPRPVLDASTGQRQSSVLALAAVALFLALVTLSRSAHADSPLDGKWTQGPLKEEFTVQKWLP